MVYRRKWYKKRYYKKKALSKANIFGKKNAKSQAKQIYALNKKINNIERKTKPEIEVKKCLMFTEDNGTVGNAASEWHSMTSLYEDQLFDVNKINYQMQGHMLRPYNINLYGIFTNTLKTYKHDNISYDIPQDGYLRIILCKLVGGNQGRLPDQITEPFVEGETDFGLVNGPLKKDISSSLKVIKDKLVKISPKNTAKMWRMTIKNPGTYSRGVHSGNVNPYYKNEYVVYFQYFCPDVFTTIDGGVVSNIGPIQTVSASVKFAFTDQ